MFSSSGAELKSMSQSFCIWDLEIACQVFNEIEFNVISVQILRFLNLFYINFYSDY